uniref:Retrovirus-related Pol polyprotein from transposon TNT 1-94 n=1 Tax=Cajanus cajan TaxID=3821 RepID=A0A151R2S1_CAJCA|nr:hypothetical protein KK1_042047 [Cajanus cajan]
MLFSWLLSSLSESVLPRVLGCKHSYEIWDKIHKHYYSHLHAKKRQLRSELKSSKKGPSQPISEYILRIREIINSLIVVGDLVTDQDQIDTILDGLPEDYNSFIMMIYGRSDSISVTDVESLLLVQEAQLEKYRQDLTSPSVSVNVVQGPQDSQFQSQSQFVSNRGGFQFSTRGGRYRGGRYRCRGRNRCGGRYRGGRYRGRGRNRGGGQRPTCQLCYKYGHDAFHCWNRFDEAFIQPSQPPNLSQRQGHGSAQQPQAFVTTQTPQGSFQLQESRPSDSQA